MHAWVSEVVKGRRSASANPGLIVEFPENMAKPKGLYHKKNTPARGKGYTQTHNTQTSTEDSSHILTNFHP